MSAAIINALADATAALSSAMDAIGCAMRHAAPETSDTAAATPWTLPPPPQGHEWHRGKEFTTDDLPDGYRPLLVGESVHPGDEYYDSSVGPWWVSGGWYALVPWSAKHRTKRPLPETSGKWYVIQTANGWPSYLKGPRTPQQVAKLGYGFSYNRAEAWPFDSWHKAHDAALAVILHMSWQPSRVICAQ